MIHFPRKRFLSVSTTHVIRPQDCGAEKAGSLKYFEVCSVQEKELPVSGTMYIKLYQSDRHSHLPKAEKEVNTAIDHCPIGLCE
jgi:hypothetical protein